MNRWAKRNPELSSAGVQPYSNFAREAHAEDKAANVPQYVERNDRCSSTTSDRCGKCFGCAKREDFEHDARQERGDE